MMTAVLDGEPVSVTVLPATGLLPSSKVTSTVPVGCGHAAGHRRHDGCRRRHRRLGCRDAEVPEGDADAQAGEGECCRSYPWRSKSPFPASCRTR